MRIHRFYFLGDLDKYVLVDYDKCNLRGYPDGMTLDVDGFLWIASVDGGSEVTNHLIYYKYLYIIFKWYYYHFLKYLLYERVVKEFNNRSHFTVFKINFKIHPRFSLKILY